MIGRTVSHYEIVEALGGGGMGVVYKARDTSLERFVALKFLPPEWSRDPDFKERFRREAQAASALEHPNICTIHEIGETDDGQMFIVMAAYEGETIKRKIERGPLAAAAAVDLAAQVADGLAKAHEAGFVHRDVKPANLFVTEDGHAKILDFGLAKLAGQTNLTKEGTTVGTVAYMSPEQARGEEVDARSDVWSLGAVLYEMLVGRPPFPGGNEQAVIYGILEREPPPLAGLVPGAPAAVVATVERSLAKDAAERQGSAREFADALRGLAVAEEAATEVRPAAGSPIAPESAPAVTGEAPTAALPATPPATRSAVEVPAEGPTGAAVFPSRRGLAIAAGAAAIVVLVGLAWLVTGRRSAEEAGAGAGAATEPVLAETDTVLLIDLENRTDDPVFDGTLRQALAIKLAESPFLTLASDRTTAETMEFMGLAPDDRVTLERGLEICQRQGDKAVVGGEIAPLGTSYVINLSAVACASGDALSRHQVQAQAKENVLTALGAASIELREALGESLDSVEAFDVPLEQATTDSLDALKAYSIGIEKRDRGLEEESIAHFRRAIALDPDFALAYGRLGTVLSNLERVDESVDMFTRAYELRDRVTQAERFYIEAANQDDLESLFEIYETWIDLYPRALDPTANLAFHYIWLGKLDEAVELAERAVELGPDTSWTHRHLALAYLQAGRLDDARGALERAFAKGFELPPLYQVAYAFAYLDGETERMRELAEEHFDRPGAWLGREAAGVAASAGRLERSRSLLERTAASAVDQGFEESASTFLGEGAVWMALFGEERAARDLVDEALTLEVLDGIYFGATGLALVGAREWAETLAAELPQRSMYHDILRPAISAAVHLARDEPAAALVALEPARAWELGHPMVMLLRGRAHLGAGDAAAAIDELERIVALPGVRATDPVHTIVHLDLARARAAAGDLAASRAAYEAFFARLIEADDGVAEIEAARAEYAALGGSDP